MVEVVYIVMSLMLQGQKMIWVMVNSQGIWVVAL